LASNSSIESKTRKGENMNKTKEGVRVNKRMTTSHKCILGGAIIMTISWAILLENSVVRPIASWLIKIIE
jgi:hypothetical protein